MAELDLELVAGLKAGLGDLTGELRRQRQVALDLIPVDVSKQFAGVAVTGTNLVLTGPDAGPEQGYVWLVRRVVVSGPNWASTVTGSLELYATALLPSLIGTGRQASELFDQNGTVPYRQYYANRQVPVQENENVIAVVVGATTGQNVVFALRAEQYSIKAIRDARLDV